jgi:hypothetical protein
VSETTSALAPKKTDFAALSDPDRRNHAAEEPLNVCFDGDSEFTTTKNGVIQ